MTGTPPDWRVKLRKGDVLSTTATYDTRRAAWWESMGIMVAYMADERAGQRPVQDAREPPGPRHPRPPGRERQPRRRATGLPGPAPARPTARATRASSTSVDFKYQLGDLSLGGPERAARR